MAVNNQHHNHANSATTSVSPSSSSAAAATYQHFQPWRSSSGSEHPAGAAASVHHHHRQLKPDLVYIKKEIIDHSELSPRDYNNHRQHNSSMQNNHPHGQHPPHPLPYPTHIPPATTTAAATTSPGSLPYPPLQGPQVMKGTMATYRDGNPEFDLKMQQCIEEGNDGVTEQTRRSIVSIIESITLLKPPERVLLYLRMPGANCEADPLRQAQNPLGARSEINHTINWVRSHLEPDPNVSIPKKDVFEDYIAFCGRNNIKPLSTADFGKVMKQVFPTVRPRRLGTRGHSRYCYAAMRKATKLDPPMLPDLSNAKGSADVSVFSNGPVEQSPPGGLSSSKSSPVRKGSSKERLYSSEYMVSDATSWTVVRKWAQGVLNVRLNSMKDLADHIVAHKLDVQQQLPGQSIDDVGEASSGSRTSTGAAAVKESKKIKDKRKEPPNKTTASSPRKRRKKRRKNSTSGSENGGVGGSESETTRGRLSLGASKGGGVRVKKELTESGNDEDRIMDLKLRNGLDQQQQGGSDGSLTRGVPLNTTTTVKLKLNDVPMDDNASAAEEDPQIENVYCKKVRQAQQAKGLWFQQQQQQQQQGPGSSTGQSSVIVTPHTFSQPEIPSPSMLNQMNQQLRLQQQQQQDSLMPKNLMNKRGTGADGGSGGGDDGTALPSDFITNALIPRERVISICNMDKDALDDYLPLAGDNSQEAEIMQYFDDNSSNGQSSGTTENNSPKVEGADGNNTAGSNSGGAGGGAEEDPADQSQGNNNNNNSGAPSIIENYSSMFPDQGRPVNNGGKQNIEGPEKINQLRQFLHQNFQSGSNTGNRLVQNQSMGLANLAPVTTTTTGPYPGSASASLAMLSQRHNTFNYAAQANVGMDLSQDPMGQQQPQQMTVVSGRPVSLKRRVMATEIPDEDEPQHRRFVPITPPQGLAPAIVVDYTSSRARMEPVQSRYDDFLSPKMAAMRKQQAMNILKPTVSQGNGPLASSHQGTSNVGGMPMGSANGIFQADERKTAFSKPVVGGGGGGKYIQQQQQQSPGGGGGYDASVAYTNSQDAKALNMSYAESRSQSVPLNYRQSPVQHVVTSSNDGTSSWSSSQYQTNNNNAPSSACSSVAQTPIPPEYNDFTDLSMMNMWASDAVNEDDDEGGGGGSEQQQSGDKLFKDGNNNNEDDFIEELKGANGFVGFGGPSNSSIISRSVPSTPLPTINTTTPNQSGYYGKGYFNGNNGTSSSSFGHSSSGSYSGQQGGRHGGYDASKSVPTTPISSVSSNQFRYSPVSSADVVVGALNRSSRDMLINGSCIAGGGGAFGVGGGSNVDDGGGEGGGGGGQRNGEEMIERGVREGRKRREEAIMEKELEPLEDEMGFDDPMMDTDLMNQFKGEF